MPLTPNLAPALRDPAWVGRVFWALASLLILWPILVLSEFTPWVLFEPGALKPAWNFIKAFFPPKHDADFLFMLARETWRTVAMATAGMTLALLLALPLALMSVRVLSLSAITGSMAFLPSVFRQLVRWTLMVLRSVPELVWALVFVRVVGLGPTSGVLAIALTYLVSPGFLLAMCDMRGTLGPSDCVTQAPVPGGQKQTEGKPSLPDLSATL